MTTGPDGVAGAAGTMCDAFQATVAAHGDVVALRTLGGEQELTWREYGERVRRLAAGLHGLGLRRGAPLARMLGTRPEFHLVDAEGACCDAGDEEAGRQRVGIGRDRDFRRRRR